MLVWNGKFEESLMTVRDISDHLHLPLHMTCLDGMWLESAMLKQLPVRVTALRVIELELLRAMSATRSPWMYLT